MMTGSISKRVNKKGVSYRGVIELGECTKTGKRLRKYFTAPTKKEAERMKNKLISEYSSGSYLETSNKTVKGWIEEWLDTFVYPTYSPNTIRSYELVIKGHILPAFGHIKLQELTTLDLQNYYKKIAVYSPVSKRSIEPKTIRNVNMVMMAALSRAEKLELVRKNVARAVELPKQKKYVAEVYDREEIARLLAVAKGTSMETAINILIFLGLRRGELLALRFSDIDFEKNTVRISKSIHKVKGAFVEKPPKTDAGHRLLNAPPSLMEVLQKAREKYEREKAELGSKFHDGDFVIWRKGNGRPHDPDHFSYQFKQFITTNGFKCIRLHDMRHTNASLLLTLGVSPKVAQKRLGHSNFGITMDTYSHVLDEVEREATDKLEEALSPLV